MRRLFCLLCLSFGLMPTVGEAPGAEPFRYRAGEHGKGVLKSVDDVPVLILQGTPAEMGEQTGVLAARQAKPLFDFPRDYFLAECAAEMLRTNPTWTKQDAQFKLALAAAGTALWPQVQKKAASLEGNFPVAHRAELDALAAAAGEGVVGRGPLVAANGMFDLAHVPQAELLHGCSSVVIPPSHSQTRGLLLGRNLDFPHFGYLHRYSLLVVYRSNDPRKHSFASAGFPGFVGSVTGMNDAGLTVASHEVDDPGLTTPFNPKGVPFAMAYRRVLEECATIGEALALLDGLERTSATSLVIADTKGGAVIELTPDALAVRRFKDKPGVCTNHFCAMRNPKQTDNFQTITRFQGLTKSVDVKKDGGFSVADVQEQLHGARLFDHEKDDLTIQTFVFEPAERKVHLRFGNGKGPATAGKLATLDLNTLWGK